MNSNFKIERLNQKVVLKQNQGINYFLFLKKDSNNLPFKPFKSNSQFETTPIVYRQYRLVGYPVHEENAKPIIGIDLICCDYATLKKDCDIIIDKLILKTGDGWKTLGSEKWYHPKNCDFLTTFEKQEPELTVVSVSDLINHLK